MSEQLVVVMNGTTTGTLGKTRSGLTFEYEQSYQDQPGATPLSVSMPLAVQRHRSSAVTPWLWGLLPDNADVLRRWARQFQTSASSPFSMLATPVGEDCPGAVQFIVPDRVDEALARPGRIAWLDESQVAERLASLRRDATAWLGADFTGQFSLGGAQAKTALFFDGTRWGLPSGAQATTHILKTGIAGLDDHDLNEHLCMAAARRASLIVARSSIARFADQTAVVVERYDRRTVDGGRVMRIHQEDLCQALGVAPVRKYQAEGGPGLAAIGSLLRDVVKPVAAGTAAVESLLDAAAWSWIIGGTDAHAKNYSLLLAGGQVRLAPLYDIASALPYDGVDEFKLRMAMKLGGEYRLKAHDATTWPKVARELGLDRDQVVERVTDLVRRAPDSIADAAREPDVVGLGRALPARLVDAVQARADRCAQQLTSAHGATTRR